MTTTLSPAVTVVFALVAESLTMLIAPSMVFEPVPPIFVVVIAPVIASLVVEPPITFLTLFATSYSWLPFTASVDVEVKAPALTLVNATVVVEPTPPNVTLSFVVALSYLTAALSVAVC
ncbi:MAG: hypothetical protein GAK29_04972 [Acinetobacter bereziniae]|uniref:Uncharacterized protein n=1 Tax=Acinetobacter bereziniae TaxID=106648 RepID=A0A833UHX6_ACIBZ|nr:MAG: hypothetical protein GAK29_04972 [Acinetobacter bereziniae]